MHVYSHVHYENMKVCSIAFIIINVNYFTAYSVLKAVDRSSSAEGMTSNITEKQS